MEEAKFSGSSIQVAAKLGHLEVVEFLITAGADVNQGTPFSTPLLDAIAAGQTEIALKLIAAGADVSLTAEFDCVPPIAIAAIYGTAEIMQALIAAGADVDAIVPRLTVGAESVMDSTAIILAARWGQTAVVQTLIQAGADCWGTDGMGLSAIDWASKNHHAEVLEILRSRSHLRQGMSGIAPR